MKIIIKTLILCGVLLTTAYSCEKEEVPVKISIETINDLSVCGDKCHLRDVNYKNAHYIIDNQNEFESLFECDSGYVLPYIDFSNYNLLFGSQMVNGICPTIINQELLKYTNEKKIIYKVTIKEGGYTALGNAYYHTLIPKTENQYHIEFNVTVVPFLKK